MSSSLSLTWSLGAPRLLGVPLTPITSLFEFFDGWKCLDWFKLIWTRLQVLKVTILWKCKNLTKWKSFLSWRRGRCAFFSSVSYFSILNIFSHTSNIIQMNRIIKEFEFSAAAAVNLFFLVSSLWALQQGVNHYPRRFKNNCHQNHNHCHHNWNPDNVCSSCGGFLSVCCVKPATVNRWLQTNRWAWWSSQWGDVDNAGIDNADADAEDADDDRADDDFVDNDYSDDDDESNNLKDDDHNCSGWMMRTFLGTAKFSLVCKLSTTHCAESDLK